MKAILQPANRKEMTVLALVDFLIIAIQCLKRWDVIFCPCQEARASISEEVMQRSIREKEHDDSRIDCLRNKGYNIVQVWECNCWKRIKEEDNVRNDVPNSFCKIFCKLTMKQEPLFRLNKRWEIV